MKTIAVFGLLACASASAQQLGGPMKHLLIGQVGQSLQFAFETPVDGPLEMNRAGSDEFSGVASVLNGQAYNAQFGWLASGFFNLPSGSGVFVETISQSPRLSVYDGFDFAPILGTDGSSNTWEWSGAMTHNWYASAKPGEFFASYEVYVGDAFGNRLEGWGSAFVDLSWTFSLTEGVSLDVGEGVGPAPSPGAGVALAGLLVGRRRRK